MNEISWWIFIILFFGPGLITLLILFLIKRSDKKKMADYYGMQARFIDREAKIEAALQNRRRKR
jgi:hypothetical protein